MRTALVGLATMLALSGFLWTADLMLGAGTAHAACSTNNGGNQPPECAPPEGPPGCYTSHICSQMWCPNLGELRRMPDWDRNVCHTYYFAPDSGLPALMVQGQPPGLRLPPNTGVCPPLAWMCP